MRARFSSLVPLLGALAIGACEEEGRPPLCPEPTASAAPISTETAPPAGDAGATPPTPQEAAAFMDDVEAHIHRLWAARDRAAWVNETFITDDTETVAAAGESATAGYVGDAIKRSKRFVPIASQLPADLARKLYLLSIAQNVPAPANDAKREELAGIETWMMSTYGKGQYCPMKGSPLMRARGSGACLHLDDLQEVLAKNRDYDTLLEAWKGWHAIAAPMKDRYAHYVDLANEGARDIGFADVGAMWRSAYDMSPADFEADVERLWAQVKPLYDALHCYVRARLRETYGKDKVPEHGPIPAHLLGNMWAQEWNNVADLVTPYKGEPSLDVSKKLVGGKWDALRMVRQGEHFFTALGFDPLPQTFWERSQFTRPRDREVVCHASAWDVSWNDDLRIKMCIQPTEEDLVTIHHELGHDFYFSRYYKMPILFQQGANGGFHEAIGDTIALSVTPDYLRSVGLLDAAPSAPKGAQTKTAGDHGRINQQMKMALDKVAFLPFGLLIDKWRWDAFAGKTTPADYNAAWWKLKEKYQGVSAPVPRSVTDFDPGAKYHVASSTPYVIYFLARIYQFQFHKALCQAAGYSGPLDQCSIHDNPQAGAKLLAMLSLGASKPWPDAMEAIGAGRKADAGPMLEYFAPLVDWLSKANAGQQCGW